MIARDYFMTMCADLPCQFREKAKIRGLLSALSKQLDGVQQFFSEINLLRSVDTAAGVQLDGIGDIVCLSRADALSLSAGAMSMGDETYRKWLKYKIAVNTSNGTYADIMNAVKMLVGNNRVGYRESPSYPATAILDVSGLEYEDILTADLLRKIKAAGVRLTFTVYDRFSTLFYIDGLQEELFRAKFSVVLAAPNTQALVFSGGLLSELHVGGFSGEARASPATGYVHIGGVTLTAEKTCFSASLSAPRLKAEARACGALSSAERIRLACHAHAPNAGGALFFGGAAVSTTERTVI